MTIQDLSQQPLSLLSQIELSPITRYYLTQLIRQNLDRLVLDEVKDLPPHPQRPVSQDGHLRLERLALEHQTLISQGAIHQDSVKGIETEISQHGSVKGGRGRGERKGGRGTGVGPGLSRRRGSTGSL